MNEGPNDNDQLPIGVRVEAPVQVNLGRTEVERTADQALWVAIRNRTDAIGFARYNHFIDAVLCRGVSPNHGGAVYPPDDERRFGSPSLGDRRTELNTRPAIYGADAYNLLKFATEVFLLVEAGVVKLKDGAPTLVDPDAYNATDEASRLGGRVELAGIEQLLQGYFGNSLQLPYLHQVVDNLGVAVATEGSAFCEFLLQHRLTSPSLIELIWSYWHEEGMLVQTMKAIALRFENRRNPQERDPLANLELDPLRPLNNLLWGYIQDEYRQITVLRRAYEYDHHYGLSLVGKAVPNVNGADSRSKFIEAFHNLLHRTAKFFKEDSDTTVIADGFPLLNALREVHMLLAEGAHNQFGDLPWTARVQMLTEQWLLARPEMQQFLRGRFMVPYQEGWMGAVDAMKRLQGWTDVSVMHFYNLAIYGERILLSIRYGNWNDINTTQQQAKNWARYWQAELQGYIHAYSVVTGVDLAVDVTNSQDATVRVMQPSILLSRRLSSNGSRPMLPANGTAAAPRLPAQPRADTWPANGAGRPANEITRFTNGAGRPANGD